jgi:hypothetical protein
MPVRTLKGYFALLLLASLTLGAEPPATLPSDSAADPKELEALILQLGDPDFAKRDAAQKAIGGFGADAISILEEATKIDDPEISSRARAAIQAIQSSARETRVTLHLKDVTVRRALETLFKQTNLKLDYARGSAPKLLNSKISIDVIRAPFWTVLLQICEAAELRPESYTRDQPGIILTDQGATWSSQFTRIEGPFAISLTSLKREVQINYGLPSRLPSGTELVMTICPEMRIRAQGVRQVKVTRCEDETGFPIAPDASRPYLLNGFPAMVAIMLHPEDSKRIALMEGEVIVTLEEAPQHIEVPAILKTTGALRAAGGVRLLVKGCRQSDEKTWTLQINFLRDGHDNVEMKEIVERLSKSRPRLEDGFARPLDQGFVKLRETEEAVEMELTYMNFADHGRGAPSEPAKLLWDVPTSTKEKVVPFQFKDVPLP